MLTAEAQIQTGDPGRYLVRLSRHASQMRRHLGHGPRSHDRGDAPPEVRHAEWSDTYGLVRLSWGQWTMQASPGMLTLRAEAADEDNLRRIQDLLTGRLEKFGRREQLKVTWRPARAGPAAPDGAAADPHELDHG
jgi:hypothetical protein